MSDTKTHTVTLKGAGNGEPWLVLGGATTDDLEAQLQAAFPELEDHLSLPEMIWRAQAMWAAVRAVTLGGLTGAPDGSQAVQAPPAASQGYQGQQAAYGQQAPAQGAPGPAPACQHGPRVFRSAKPGSGKTWKGWFCPAPQGTQDQCKPQFVN